MTEQEIRQSREKVETLLTLQRAPSQFSILFHLLGTGRTLTVKELSAELNLTPKATERAVAKLLDKGLIERAPFRDGAYTCDMREILLSLFMVTTDIYEHVGLQEKKARM